MAEDNGQYDAIFEAAGREWDIDPKLLKALAIHEGGLNPNARGSSGEVGMTQIMPATAQHLGITNLRDPVQQIYGAAKYLNEALTAEHENSYAALAYYNGGAEWRSNPRRDVNYPLYVGGQYRKLGDLRTDTAADTPPEQPPAKRTQVAQADTGTATDATPAPAQPDPAHMSDTEWLDTMGKKYPSLLGPNADRQPSKPEAPKVTDDEFLKSTGAGTGSGGGSKSQPSTPSDADFLASTGGAPAPRGKGGDTGEPAQHGWLVRNALALGRGLEQGAEDVVHTGVNLGNWVDQRVPALAALDRATGIDNAREAAKLEAQRQEYEASPEGQSTAGAIGRMGGQAIMSAPVVGPVGEAAAVGGNLLLRGASGLVPWLARTAGQGAAMGGAFGAATSGSSDAPLGAQVVGGAEAGAVAGPVFDAAGRLVRPVVNALQGSGGAVGRMLWTPGERPPPMPPPVDPYAARVAEVTGQPPPTAAATPPAQPQGVGAEWSGANGARIVGISPAEEAAYRVNAEGQKLIEPQPVGVPDRTAYVPGVNPNLAEQEQQVNTARELKGLQIRSTDASQQAKEIAGEHNQARTTFLNNNTGSETDILRETAQRQRDIEQAKPQVFAPENVTGPVDHAPIVAKINEILDTPENRQNDAVQKVIRPLIDRMVNEDGTAKITDPREWWGMRQQIDRWTSKRMETDDPNLHYAAHDLNQIANVIDQQIEKVAPGYDAMIAKYAEHSRNIGAMRVLQDEAKKVYTSGGGTMRMTFEGVQRMMKHIVDMRNADPTDLNPYKHISPETMGNLWALRDDLRRSASAIELAKTPGSDTAQNLWDMIKGLASGPEAQHALSAFAATHLGLPGYGMMRGAQMIVGALNSGRQAARDAARAQEILRPPVDRLHPLTPP